MRTTNPRILGSIAIVAVVALSLAGVHSSGAAKMSGEDTPVPLAEALAPLAKLESMEARRPSIAYGMNGFYAPEVREKGADLQYGQVWIGRWYDKAGADAKFRKDVAEVSGSGLTPVVEWWYWGDQISTKAVSKGLPDGRSLDRWHHLGPKMAKAACDASGGNVVIVVETEFNKGGIGGMERFDGELAKQIRGIKTACPTATVVLGFGMWGEDEWHRFDRAAKAADGVGFQVMRSLAKDSRAEYLDAPDRAVRAAGLLQDLFGKPIWIHDMALSSYGKGGKDLQARILEELLAKRGELEEKGVVLMLYRSVRDTPSMVKNNYYGDGEAHWGLMTKGGRAKPALNVWVTAVA